MGLFQNKFLRQPHLKIFLAYSTSSSFSALLLIFKFTGLINTLSVIPLRILRIRIKNGYVKIENRQKTIMKTIGNINKFKMPATIP